eukprot:3296054-Lingulodinium_polyedra.AAC.1
MELQPWGNTSCGSATTRSPLWSLPFMSPALWCSGCWSTCRPAAPRATSLSLGKTTARRHGLDARIPP